MTALRAVLGVLGLAGIGVGVWEISGFALGDIVNAVEWLVVGVVAHDFVFAPAVLLVGLVGSRLLPRWAKTPVVAGVVVLVTVTLAVAPTLAQVGAERYNPSLMDRPYLAGWLVFAGIVVLATALACVYNRNRAVRDGRPPPDGRRADRA